MSKKQYNFISLIIPVPLGHLSKLTIFHSSHVLLFSPGLLVVFFYCVLFPLYFLLMDVSSRNMVGIRV